MIQNYYLILMIIYYFNAEYEFYNVAFLAGVFNTSIIPKNLKVWSKCNKCFFQKEGLQVGRHLPNYNVQLINFFGHFDAVKFALY